VLAQLVLAIMMNKFSFGFNLPYHLLKMQWNKYFWISSSWSTCPNVMYWWWFDDQRM